jgi:hypothetical protein|nr:hypothetical protein [uncultured Flavobacterium sp.]
MNLKTNCQSLSGGNEDAQILKNDYNQDEFTQFFPNVNSILIPKKAEYNLRKYVSKPMLKTIDCNVNIAVEKCLVMLSNLASTYYTDDKWKSLNATLLHQQSKTTDNTYIYTRIIDTLKHGTKTGAFIEVDESYEVGAKSKRFRLTDVYLKAGLIPYTIKNAGIIQVRNKMFYRLFNEAMTHPICYNLIKIYPKIDLPTSEELLKIGKQLVKDGYSTKKGKILTMRNKHKNEYWKDVKNRSFVEDNIALFEFLTGRGYMIPSAGDEKSGGRVVDSFTLMPAWIREQITVDGIKLVESDYTALHPNIAIKLYGGSQTFLTHQNVAERTGIDVKGIKIEHLSFFNKQWLAMLKSPLFAFYSNHEPDMLSRIYNDKKEHGHKVTSAKMFSVEVAIMTEVIKCLNSKGVFVLYVYDALLCEDKNKALVIETMNRIILEHGVKTNVKSDGLVIEPLPGPKAEVVAKYALDEIVNLYDVLPQLSFSVDDTIKIIYGINRSKVPMLQLVNYIGKQNKEQKYLDYDGVSITSFVVTKLKAIVKRL